jgi:hypothetical protein
MIYVRRLSRRTFAALQDFWNNKKTLQVTSEAQAVLVLPNNYGYGMCQSQDAIWGLWNTHDKSAQIWNVAQYVLGRFGSKIDFIFSDSATAHAQYKEIYYWNSIAPSYG